MAETHLEKFKKLLGELFMFDQADLDFGIYRIMNAKRDEITRFLENDLLPQVRQSLGELEAADRKGLETELAKAIEQARGLGVDPETTQKVKELRQKLAATADIEALESEVFSHLYSFFRRYYNEGDFLSLRRYKEGVYAIPYEGEEVKLHWANHDQYYIKTAEYFRDYTFKPPDGRRVHFKLVEANTEQNNNKSPVGQDRRFILSEAGAVLEENGELVIRFEYRPDAEKRKQADLNADASQKILNAAASRNWLAQLAAKAPTEKNPDRTLLDKRLADYTARNTFDYFIHKDLGGFLRRELDFFIKNEVMHLDDVESETAHRVEQYLAKIMAIRRIAHKIIDFLAQLEGFQKKLWLKKKFVVETNYCITLDRIPEELYQEIAANQAQREAWVGLFAIDELKGNLTEPAYAIPLTVEFLKANSFLPLDTKFVDERTKSRILASLSNVEEQLNGLLIESENFQALNLIQSRYQGEVKCTYIDPPYNTGQDGFPYKDSYQHASWLSMINNRVLLGNRLQARDGVLFVSIGEDEQAALRQLLIEVFGSDKGIGMIVWKARVKPVNIGEAKYRPQKETEYVLAYETEPNAARFRPLLTGAVRIYPHTLGDRRYRLNTILKSNRGVNYRSTMSFEIDGYTPPEGQRWQASEEVIRQLKKDAYIEFRDGTPFVRYFEDEEGAEHDPFYCFMDIEWSGTSEVGKSELNDILGKMHGFDTVKPTRLIRTLITSCTQDAELVADFFAGSGTTGHAVIHQNRDDGMQRRYILVEIGPYFQSLVLPRILRAVYSKDWEDGRPVSREGSSHIMKYLRLESYEDTLNNLELQHTREQGQLLAQHAEMRQDYVLRYMLDVESQDSPSLLNLIRFEDPFNYKLKVSTGSAGETKDTTVDLMETFNYLLGLHVKHIDTIRGFRVVQGRNPAGEKVLVIWRNTREKPNAELDEFFLKQGYNTRDMEFDLIYVNGDNNLENLKRPDETWKVRLIEEDFKRLMFDVQDV